MLGTTSALDKREREETKAEVMEWVWNHGGLMSTKLKALHLSKSLGFLSSVTIP